MSHSRLKKFGKSILRILRSGGTTELTRFDYLINESVYNARVNKRRGYFLLVKAMGTL